MIKIKEKLSLLTPEIAFYIGAFLFIFSSWMSRTEFEFNKWPLIVVGGILFLYKMAGTEYTIKEIMIAFMLLLVGSASAFATNTLTPVWCALLVVAMKNVLLKVMLKILLGVSVFITTLEVSLSLLGISGIIYKEYYGRTDSCEIRYHLGTAHPNTLHFRFLIIAMLVCALWYTRLKLVHYIMLLAMNFALGMLTLSRAGMLCSFILLFGIMLAKYVPYIFYSKKLYRFIVWSAVAFILVTTLGMVLYNESNPVWLMLNKLTSTRLELANQCYNVYGISLFGTEITGILFDMGIARMLVENGVVYFALFFIGFFTSLAYVHSRRQYNLFVIMLTMLIYSAFERLNMYAYFNIQFFIIAYAIWNVIASGDKIVGFIPVRTPRKKGAHNASRTSSAVTENFDINEF